MRIWVKTFVLVLFHLSLLKYAQPDDRWKGPNFDVGDGGLKKVSNSKTQRAKGYLSRGMEDLWNPNVRLFNFDRKKVRDHETGWSESCTDAEALSDSYKNISRTRDKCIKKARQKIIQARTCHM